LKILIASHNKKKRDEIKTLLKEFKNIGVLNLDDLDVSPPIIVEDGKTFRQNSVKKSVTMSKFFDGLVIADDSGLCVDALDGRPGVRSARFARAKATDTENTEKLLKLLDKIPDSKRTAQFDCCMSLAKGGNLLGTFEGKVRGVIAENKKGSNGFGYDPVFVPKGYEKTFAEMAPSYKNRISHRAIALKKLKKHIKKVIGKGRKRTSSKAKK
jgi:XTP/dITP diphosphohydrolase